MHPQWTQIDTAELILIASGAVLLVAGVLTLSVRRRWSGALAVAPPPENRVEPLDVLVTLAAMWLVPSTIYALIAPADDAPAMQPSTSPADAIDEAKIIAAFAVQVIALVILLAIGRYRFRGGLSGWGFDIRRAATRFSQAVIAYVAVWPLCFAALHLTVFVARLIAPGFEPQEHATIRTLLSGEAGTIATLLTVGGALIVAPISEELFFRGLFQPLLAKASHPRVAVILSGLAFGAFHVPLYHAMPALAVFGIALGYLYARTGSLLLVILLHIVFNGKTLLWLALGYDA